MGLIIAAAITTAIALGVFAGMVLHFLLNFPIYLAQIDAFGLGRAGWVTALLLWVVAMVIAGAVMVWRLEAPPTGAASPS